MYHRYVLSLYACFRITTSSCIWYTAMLSVFFFNVSHSGLIAKCLNCNCNLLRIVDALPYAIYIWSGSLCHTEKWRSSIADCVWPLLWTCLKVWQTLYLGCGTEYQSCWLLLTFVRLLTKMEVGNIASLAHKLPPAPSKLKLLVVSLAEEILQNYGFVWNTLKLDKKLYTCKIRGSEELKRYSKAHAFNITDKTCTTGNGVQ